MYDYMVVGQGIAGTVLTEHLIQAGQKVLVFDDPSHSTSSRVAGGLYNPITGRKMVKTWKADVLFPYLIDFYSRLELLLSARFLMDVPIYRPFLSIEELNEWTGKSSDKGYRPFISKVMDKSAYGEHLHDAYGGLLLAQSGYLDTVSMLTAYRLYLQEKGTLISETFHPEKLELQDGGVVYQGHRARRVIFCDGPLLQDNPFFDWLPMRPVKGELLYIKADVKMEAIYNRGVFVIPINGGICKVGATYDHSNLDTTTTERAANQLKEKLSGLVKFPYEVVDQVAGIRPATRDRRPMIGIHPQLKQVGVFGGMGTKGVSLAPYFANDFVQHLTKKNELPEEVNIARFFSLS